MNESGFTLLEADNSVAREKWIQLWQQWPDREVFAHPDYLDLFSGQEDRVMCASLQGTRGSVLFPFLLRNLPRENFVPVQLRNSKDISTPYGYGGPFFWGDQSGLATLFWSAFDMWAKKADVISEFLRLSLFSDSLLEYPGSSEVWQNNVVRELEPSIDEIWMDFEHKVRKNVKKAERAGIVIEVDYHGLHFDDFYRIYTGTMHRRDASSGYYFERSFFDRIHSNLFGHFLYFHAFSDGVIVSTELVLVSENNLYSFLGGTDVQYFGSRPNDLLKFAVMKWGKERGKRRFVLGGGYEPDDGIFRYKKAFAPDGLIPYRTGTRIIDQYGYEQLVSARWPTSDDASDIEPRSGYFPAYRA